MDGNNPAHSPVRENMQELNPMHTGEPIFIGGVPRSGTTLLRMMLDSHCDLMCGPESPWITGRGKSTRPNLRSLVEFLTKGEWAATQGLSGVDPTLVHRAVARFIHDIVGTSMATHGKKRWVDKTPGNAISIPFLSAIFPKAKFVHVLRDGRDVALSTIATKWRTIQSGAKTIKNTYQNTLERWIAWTRCFDQDSRSCGVSVYEIKYENLVGNTEAEMRKLLAFLETDWDERVMDPYAGEHDVIAPEKGEGVRSFNKHSGIVESSVFAWKDKLTYFQKRWTKNHADTALMMKGYQPTI